MIHLFFPRSGRHDGDMRLLTDLEFHGQVTGSVTVPAGRRLRFYGNISGDLIVQRDAQAAIYGSIAGAVLNHGADVNILGRAGAIRDMGGTITMINDRQAMARMPETAAAEIPPAKPRARTPQPRQARTTRRSRK